MARWVTCDSGESTLNGVAKSGPVSEGDGDVIAGEIGCGRQCVWTLWVRADGELAPASEAASTSFPFSSGASSSFAGSTVMAREVTCDGGESTIKGVAGSGPVGESDADDIAGKVVCDRQCVWTL